MDTREQAIISSHMYALHFLPIIGCSNMNSKERDILPSKTHAVPFLDNRRCSGMDTDGDILPFHIYILSFYQVSDVQK